MSEELLAEAEKALASIVETLDELIAESGGVYGLHLNGDGAPWSEITEGGRFEGWLLPLETARATLAKLREAKANSHPSPGPGGYSPDEFSCTAEQMREAAARVAVEARDIALVHSNEGVYQREIRPPCALRIAEAIRALPLTAK